MVSLYSIHEKIPADTVAFYGLHLQNILKLFVRVVEGGSFTAPKPSVG